MYPELYQYLLQHKKLSVPGIGTFLLERTPAQVDFPNKQVAAPVYAFSLQSTAPVPSGRFFTWLGAALGISQMDAVIRFNDFAFDMKKQVEKGHTIEWSGVGVLKKGLADEIRFTAFTASYPETSVPAAKVIREKASHSVRVGEDERSSAEMEVLLNREEEKKSYWWAWSLAIGLLAIVFTGWYFSKHGVDTGSTANTKPLVPDEAVSSTYHLLP